LCAGASVTVLAADCMTADALTKVIAAGMHAADALLTVEVLGRYGAQAIVLDGAHAMRCGADGWVDLPLEHAA
jgi:thiamine biosynthesis lipoprotein ApbE